MSGGKKLVKVLSIIFGIILAVSIFTGIICAIVALGIGIERIVLKFPNAKNEKDINIYDNVDIYNEIKIYDDENIERINNLDIFLEGINLNLISGDYQNIVVEKSNLNNIQSKVSAYIKNGTLVIKEKDDIVKFGFLGFNFDVKDEGTITVKIPKEYDLSLITLNIGTGNLYIKNITSSRIELDFGAGNTKIDGLVAKYASINTGIGNTTMNNMSIGKLDLETGIGKSSYYGTISDDSKIETGIGKLDLSILGKYEEYMLDIEKGIGNVEVQRKNGLDEKLFNIYENTKNNEKVSLKIENGIGGIDITFIE